MGSCTFGRCLCKLVSLQSETKTPLHCSNPVGNLIHTIKRSLFIISNLIHANRQCFLTQLVCILSADKKSPGCLLVFRYAAGSSSAPD